MAAANAIKRNKIKLQKILGANFKYILDGVYQISLITDHEFNDLNNLKEIIGLVDKIMGKGEDTCKRFLDLLQTDPEIQGIFPDLKTIQWKDPLKRDLEDPKHQNHDGPVYSKRRIGDDQDKLTSNPTSLSVYNINNLFLPRDVQPSPPRKVKHNQKENVWGVHSTPQKMPPHDDRDDTATGFIHCVTPITMSAKPRRDKYFNAVLQTGPDKFNHTVIFSLEKHTRFIQAQNNSTPVKLSRIKKSYLGFSDDSFDVMVSDRSGMVETTVPFEPKQPTDSAKMEIVEVLKLKPNKKIGKLHAHVISKDAAIKIVNIRGEDHEVKGCLICDSSGQIQLQLWGDRIHDVKINTSYEFSNISTRPGETQLYLTCTKNTRITTIDNLVLVPKDLTVQSVDEYTIHISGEISAIDLIGKQRCGHCGKSQRVTQSAYHKCEGCRLTQCVASFTLNVSGTIVMTTPTGKANLTMPPSVLTAYLTSYNLLHLLKGTNELEEHFLNHKYFKVRHSAGNVVDLLEQG